MLFAQDEIRLVDLELEARIGVPETERSQPQRLTLCLALRLDGGLGGRDDRLENTVDYSAVRRTVLALAAARPRRLLETLADEIAATVLRTYPVCRSVDVELRKYALPRTAHVAVCLSRRQPDAGPDAGPTPARG